MTYYRLNNYFAMFLVILTTSCTSIEAREDALEEWPELPALKLQECVKAERSVQHNPLSQHRNDLLFVTAYEEYEQVTHQLKTPGNHNGKAFNAYLVAEVLADQEQSLMRVHSMALVVEEFYLQPEPDRYPLLRRWILVDTNGDGKLDAAAFGQGPVDAKEDAGRTAPAIGRIPARMANFMQTYFEKALNNLSGKTVHDPGTFCRFS